MTDHKRDKDIGEELGMTGINTAIRTVERSGENICKERLNNETRRRFSD
jgi:hypothetical protein